MSGPAASGNGTNGHEDDSVLAAVHALIAAANANIETWHRIVARAESIVELRRAGARYSDIHLMPQSPGVVEMVAQNQARLTEAAGVLRRAVARALHDEGLSYSEIAGLFGVSRQRIAGLLKEPSEPSEPSGPAGPTDT